MFNGLRLADELRVQVVLVEGVPEQKEGLAVMNRLRKAASNIVHLEFLAPVPCCDTLT